MKGRWEKLLSKAKTPDACLLMLGLPAIAASAATVLTLSPRSDRQAEEGHPGLERCAAGQKLPAGQAGSQTTPSRKPFLYLAVPPPFIHMKNFQSRSRKAQDC